MKAKGWPSMLFCHTRFHFYGNAAVDQPSILCLNFFFSTKNVLCVLWYNTTRKFSLEFMSFVPSRSCFLLKKAVDRSPITVGFRNTHEFLWQFSVVSVDRKSMACLLKIFTNLEIRLVIGGVKMVFDTRPEN